MRRENDFVKEFKNGNLNVKIPNCNSIKTIALNMESLDFYILGESWFHGQDCVCWDIYCANTGKYYIVSTYDISELGKGKTIKLTPQVIDSEVKSKIQKWETDELEEASDIEAYLIDLNYEMEE